MGQGAGEPHSLMNVKVLLFPRLNLYPMEIRGQRSSPAPNQTVNTEGHSQDHTLYNMLKINQVGY